MAPTEAEMREAFNVCDVDGKGTISVSEMAAVLKALDKDVSLAEGMIKEMDKDADGVVSFDEFKNALTKVSS